MMHWMLLLQSHHLLGLLGNLKVEEVAAELEVAFELVEPSDELDQVDFAEAPEEGLDQSLDSSGHSASDQHHLTGQWLLWPLPFCSSSSGSTPPATRTALPSF